VLVCVLVSALAGACHLTRTRNYFLEVKRGATIEERIEHAKTVVNQARFDRLKRELKDRYPDLTVQDLEHFGVKWTENWTIAADGGKTNRSVTIMLVLEERAGLDAAAVVEGAARILDAEVNGPSDGAFKSPVV